MKKFFLTLTGAALFAAATTKSEAQSTISIGPVGSIGVSRLTGFTTGGRVSPSGALGGAFLYSTETHWGFEAQALISYEGTRRYVQQQQADVMFHNNPLYFRVPLTVNYFFGKYGNNIRPKVYLGPSFAVKLTEYSGADVKNYYVENFKPVYGSGFKSFDIGGVAGAGVNVRVGHRTWLNLDASYYQGLINVLQYNGDVNYRNQNMRVNAGLMFGI